MFKLVKDGGLLVATDKSPQQQMELDVKSKSCLICHQQSCGFKYHRPEWVKKRYPDKVNAASAGLPLVSSDSPYKRLLWSNT